MNKYQKRLQKLEEEIEEAEQQLRECYYLEKERFQERLNELKQQKKQLKTRAEAAEGRRSNIGCTAVAVACGTIVLGILLLLQRIQQNEYKSDIQNTASSIILDDESMQFREFINDLMVDDYITALEKDYNGSKGQELLLNEYNRQFQKYASEYLNQPCFKDVHLDEITIYTIQDIEVSDEILLDAISDIRTLRDICASYNGSLGDGTELSPFSMSDIISNYNRIDAANRERMASISTSDIIEDR